MSQCSNQINLYIHCTQCYEEIPDGDSPIEYQDIEVGWTVKGIQIWCRRHDKNIMHIDFEGNTHPAVMG